MPIIDIFSGSDEFNDMVQSLFNDGLIGISGGRVHVRNLISNVVSEINDSQKTENYMSLTYNHPDTELGYAWDTNRFSVNDAKEIVVKQYDAKNV